MRSLGLITALVLLCASQLCSAVDASGDLAVIVNKATALDTLSSTDLRSMILGEKAKWPDGKAVVTVQSALDSPEKNLQSKTVTKMNEAALKRYYMLAVFNGKEIALPKDLPSAAALKQFVARTPGSIGCILSSDVDDSVKVLKVDGAAPGDPAYKLR